MRILEFRSYEDAIRFKLDTYNEEVINAIKKIIEITDIKTLCYDFNVNQINYVGEYYFDSLQETIDNLKLFGYSWYDRKDELKNAIDVIYNFYGWK